MGSRKVTGGSGAELFVSECGNSDGHAILFVHGYGQSHLAWIRQMQSPELTSRYRLVALDLRGHGASDKPEDGYNKTQNWADDIHAIITTLSLKKPVLVGWSYGGLVITDYVRHYGESNISGLVYVGALSCHLGGSNEGKQLFGGEFARVCAAGLYSTDMTAYQNYLWQMLALMTVRPLPMDLAYQMAGVNSVLPLHTRKGLNQRKGSNLDVLSKVTVPVLIIHGKNDKLVLPTASQQLAAVVKHSKVVWYDECGHAPFLEEPARFNRDLAEFSSSVTQKAKL